jgi:hypothetical protein
MKLFAKWCVSILLWICAATAFAASSGGPHYVIANDDVFTAGLSGVSFYAIGTTGQLTFYKEVSTGGTGIAGGYFATNRLAVLDNGSSQCVYASEAFSGDIVGISINTLEVGGGAFGSPTDTGTSNGIGIALNNQYLYASFTDSSTIGTFQIQSGCSLSFVNDVSVLGLQGGIIGAMAVHGDTLVATYNDGSIESFNISSGTPVSNGDKQNSSAYLSSKGATYPNGIDITEDGNYAIFGDTSTSTVVEVADISSGSLTKTIAYTLASSPNSSNVMLSPDETLLYVSNSQGDALTAALFDASTGKLSSGCTSPALRNYVSSFSYVASLALDSTVGNGGVVYAGGKCTLTELSGSPVADANSSGLLSIAGFPPRPF